MSQYKSISKANNYLLNQLSRGFPLRGKTGEEKSMNFQKILYDHNNKKDPRWKYESKRLWEQPRPGREWDLYQRELKRKRDRQQIAFFCKYVMAEKDIKIPMS